MFKLIWSTFAVSLMIYSCLPKGGGAQTEAIDDFLGLENEILPEFIGPQRFTGRDLHQAKGWKVVPQDVVIDLKEPNRGQNYSLISWSEMDPEDWFSISTWMAERATRDTQPDWKIKLRHFYHKELVGKVLQCKGECSIYRGTKKVLIQHLSRIQEGDEFHTDEKSVAWIFLVDGSLVRLSPGTSVTFHEMNLSLKETFFLLRLNHGHIFWNSRSQQEQKVDLLPETDSVSLPLMVTEANQEFYEREIFRNTTDEQRLHEVLTLNDLAVEKQFERLNQLILDNNSHLKIGSRVMVVTPNLNVVTKNHTFDLVYSFPGKSYLKKRTSHEDKFTLSLRGYASNEVYEISDNEWYEVSADGRSYQKKEEVHSILQILDLLTKRIKSIELAREIWIKNFSVSIYSNLSKPEVLAGLHGYSLWGNELETRYKFLDEYTRRVETTQLRSIENLSLEEGLKHEGVKNEHSAQELSEKLYQTSLKNYLLGLKTRYDKEKIKVKETSDLQFYIWILRNGKF
jgi:hypothetical protein